VTTRRYVIMLHDASSATVDAERYEINPDGSATFLVADDVPPAALRAVFTVNARGYRWIECADAGVSFSSAQLGAAPTPEPKPARLIPAAEVDDPLR
jgi:hypothetical protein